MTLDVIFLGVFLIVGFMFLLAGLIINYDLKKRNKNCYVTVKAKVKDIVRGNTSDVNLTTWFPVFEYVVSGEVIVKEYNYGGDKHLYHIGQEVDLCYNPDNCKQFYIVGDKRSKLLAIIFISLGVILPISGLILFFIIRSVGK